MKTLLAIILALTLTGCASTDYIQYAKTQEAVAVAKGQADAARYKAMADIAASGDSAAKVAAVMAMALGQGGTQAQQIAAPAPNAALQWASVLVPALTQAYGIRANSDVAMRSSDNSARTSIATTAGFVSIAGQIQAPSVSNVTTTNTDRNDSTVSNTSTVGANSGANSGNSGRLAGGYITDATSLPTVVTAPDPLIVTQPAPIVLTQPAPIVLTQPTPLIVNPVVVQPAPPLIVRPEIVLTGVAAP